MFNIFKSKKKLILDKQKSEINYEDKETCLIWWCSWSERRDEYPREILPHQHQALSPQ